MRLVRRRAVSGKRGGRARAEERNRRWNARSQSVVRRVVGGALVGRCCGRVVL